ncbi:MucR family transcriptional regulator [Streptomyces sp. NPDC096934]|uniref:MucR family transcriptional regulator n=1 Tax=Streptomyces sp. NPDC096934 TaxID=3155551 RepID=UPI00331BF581
MTSAPILRTREDADSGRHPEFGRLIRDEVADTVICHMCGHAFRSLGAHVRAHGMTAAEYREEYGLLRSRALSARSFAQQQADDRRARYLASKEVQKRFGAGREMARSGELTRRRRAVAREQADPQELRRVRQETLADGRRTQARTADDRTADALSAAGFTDLAEALRTLYADRHHSIEETARILALGRGKLRRLLTEHGIAVRPAGHNSGSGRRSRVQLNDRAAAQRVGTHDIGEWLSEQSAQGVSLRQLATATGRSVPWVTARLHRR